MVCLMNGKSIWINLQDPSDANDSDKDGLSNLPGGMEGQTLGLQQCIGLKHRAM